MPVGNIRLSEQAKNQLITLKRRTGVSQWNVLCRWAVCRSLAEPGRPPGSAGTCRQQRRDELEDVRRALGR
jgi:DNA sulfur modification protein DndE